MEALGRWTLRHKWEYRALYSGLIVFIVYRQLTRGWGPDWLDWWNYLMTTLTAFLLVVMVFLWRRQDALDEFEERTRAAVGSDANIMILTARLQLRTSSVRRLNRVMRHHDIMNVSPLDLPPEAKELRAILESVRTK